MRFGIPGFVFLDIENLVISPAESGMLKRVYKPRLSTCFPPQQQDRPPPLPCVLS
jgi:hypothetical protein